MAIRLELLLELKETVTGKIVVILVNPKAMIDIPDAMIRYITTFLAKTSMKLPPSTKDIKAQIPIIIRYVRPIVLAM